MNRPRSHRSNGSRGYLVYACMMKTIMDAPASSNELAAKHGLTRNSVVGMIRRLHRQGVVHIARWERVECRGCGWHEVWALGQGRDADQPTRKDGRSSLRQEPALPYRGQVHAFGLFMLALQEGHPSLALGELSGMQRRTVHDLVRFMRDLHLVHIAAYYQNNVGSPSPVYKIGDKRNATRPKPEGPSTAERGIAYRDMRNRRSEWCSLLHLTAGPLKLAA